ncbi:NAD(P)H-dependent oxidoreductase [Roseibium aestuarii]|uniref:NAD(P)H-dependent oxidoreductase n=1 Tax=Roseibium aestuarii TaxID=2600299 RepID=A0ABW4JSL0_9HYPH|nr:NAD(P)H-dependent oxidoreductase [Roseibium aestuarii]
MPKKILLLDGHPASETLCHGLMQAYETGARAAGHELRVHRLSAMAFDPDLGISRFRDAPPLEPALQAFWDDLEWCEHLVIVHPLWWGGWPAKLKGLIDRSFLHGKAFRYVDGQALPEALLKGRTARILMTSDTPRFFLHWIYGFGLRRQVRQQILEFCGVKLKGISEFSPVRGSKPDKRAAWLEKAHKLGTQGV